MTERSTAVDNTARGAPLLITAELPEDVLSWADALRRAHFPPERNRLRAHVTLFHALPPSSEDEVRRLLAALTAVTAPADATVSGIFNMGGGTAFDIDSPEIVAIHAAIAERMHGVLTRQDAQKLRLHVTVQNKVTADAARTLQAELRANFQPRRFRFRGLGLYAYEEGLWRLLKVYPFRG